MLVASQGPATKAHFSGRRWTNETKTRKSNIHETYALQRLLLSTPEFISNRASQTEPACSSEVQAGGKHDVALEQCAAALAGALHVPSSARGLLWSHLCCGFEGGVAYRARSLGDLRCNGSHVTCRRGASRRRLHWHTPDPTLRPACACICKRVYRHRHTHAADTKPKAIECINVTHHERIICHLMMLPSNMLGAIFKMSMNLAPRHHAYLIQNRNSVIE